MTKEEYLKLIHKYYNEVNDLEELKEQKEYYFVNDLTKIEKCNLGEAIKKSNGINFKIGKFSIIKNDDKIVLYENYCSKSNITLHRVHPNLDSRFLGRKWIKYFNTNRMVGEIPEDIFVEIIEYLYLMNKLPMLF